MESEVKALIPFAAEVETDREAVQGLPDVSFSNGKPS